ncbi:MAG: FAD-binding protein [Dehalococcoidia bacterium]|nr:FAD-binding protein [Dehalococcoidia bacterium]
MFEKSSAKVEVAGPVAAPTPKVLETDVLVIGAGIAGLTTAIEAADNGAKVIIVDKGPFAWSGSSGINWGYWFLSELDNPSAPNNPDAMFKWLLRWNEGIANQKNLRSLAERIFSEKRALWSENTGSLCVRVPPDKILLQSGTTGVPYATYPWMMGHEVMKRGIPIFERTIITRLLTDNGAAVGATGVDIKTSGFIIFKAKSTVLATGSFGWLYGWAGVSAFSPVQPECTGDGHALLYYAGAELANMEQSSGAMRQFYPATLAGSFGGVLVAPLYGQLNKAICNKDGEYFLEERSTGGSGLKELGSQRSRRGSLYETIGKQIREGKGGPNGGVFYNAKTYWETNSYKARLVVAKEKLGWDACAELIEVAPSLYDWGMGSLAQAVIDEKHETTVPGLYAVGLGTTAWDGNAWGLQAGKSAAARAAGIEKQEMDFKQASEERNRVYNILERKPKNPLRSHVIRHRVQRLAPKYIGLDRTDGGLRECIAELERIRREDYPRMWVALKTRTWNREFVEALETEFMIDVQEMVAKSALMRTESRLNHFRVDYPEEDNANWLANVCIKQVNGRMVVEKKPIVWTEVSPEQIREVLK